MVVIFIFFMFTPNLGVSWSNLSIFFRWVETNHHLESHFGLIWIPFWTGGWMKYTLIQVFCPLLTWAMKKKLDVSYSRYVFWVLKRSLKIPRLSYFNFGFGSPFHRTIPASAPVPPTSPEVQSRRGFVGRQNGTRIQLFLHENLSWAVLSDEQMSNGWPFSLLNDEQMSNKVGVEQQSVRVPPPPRCYPIRK